jgi:hypothetical protein
MLVKNSVKRMSLKEILIHPWLAQNAEVSQRRKDATQIEAFKLFSLSQPLESKLCEEMDKQLKVVEEKK